MSYLRKKDIVDSPRTIQSPKDHFLPGNPCRQLETGHELSRLGDSQTSVTGQLRQPEATQGHQSAVFFKQSPAQIHGALALHSHSQENR